MVDFFCIRHMSRAVHPSVNEIGADGFFCWQLLGYVPGGAPFSQLNIGVTDAMAIIKN